MRYVGFSFDDVAGLRASCARRSSELDEEGGGKLNRAFYLSTAPEYFPVIVKALKEADLNYDPDVDVRCIIEKPFGTDLESARELQQVVEHVFREQQVYRIDHYLGKETVQNVMAFRFANFMFEPVWNRNYIEHIQITAAEDIGIGSRAGYYDQAGALRDLVQNHMLQLLTLVCMEPPASFEADKVRDEKVKVLQAITPPTPEEVRRDTVRAQYTAGVEGGEEVGGYLEEDGVPDDSRTETYAALRLEVHNWRWAGVPIFLRTGKRLDAQGHRDRGPAQAGAAPRVPVARARSACKPNQLVLTMQPNEGVSLSLGAKIPGSSMRIRPVNMEFLYGSAFMSQSPEAYERLILDAMRGEATLFTRNDEVIAQWSIIDPILKAWARTTTSRCTPTRPAPAGPEAADELIAPAPLARACRPWTTSGARTTRRPARSRRRCGEMFAERHKEERAYVPARVMNMVVIVDKDFRGEIENRLAARRPLPPVAADRSCAVEPGRGASSSRRSRDRHRRRAAARARSRSGASASSC